MKNKKAGDKNNWKAEWINKGGSEMVQSLAILVNKIEEENKISIHWRETKNVNQYTKEETKKGYKKVRGIFLMNIVCKVYEKVKELQNENKQANISTMQTGGKKNRSTIGNLIIMNAIIEKQDKTIKMLTYCM